jgi:membrane-anchored protein YejM (alkaline phosphatase superfamily)
VPPGVETRPTSHIDVAPTILEMLGADPAARREYSFGESLLEPPQERLRTLSGWDEMAVWIPEGVLYVPLEGFRGLVEARDFRWKPLEEEDAVIARHGAEIARMARECRWFLR